jgi:transposase
MYHVHEILYRLRAGQSIHAIGDDLGHSRATIRRYARWGETHGYLDPQHPLPDQAALAAQVGAPTPPPHKTSTVEPYRPVVTVLLERGVEMQAIFQRLRDNHGYPGSYSSVRRFVHHLQPPTPDIVVRVETAPGQQAQVDFGGAGPLYDPARGTRRPAYAFVMTLSWSRHQYVEFVFDQTIATWLRCHAHAFAYFAGVPRELVIDNLKAAVLKTALEDPVISEPYRQCAHHYGFLIHPCRPRTPQHKGKVENGVHYVQRNFLAGEHFADLADANRRVRRWIEEIAGTRDHGTTHAAPLAQFLATERAALQPLPSDPFLGFTLVQAPVQRDCHVLVAGSRYSVPHQWVGTTVTVHLSDACVQIYQGVTLVASHPRMPQGQPATRLEHYPPGKALYLQRTPDVCRRQATEIGPACTEVIEGLLASRPVDKLRAAQAVIGARERYGDAPVEAACARALALGDPSWARVKDVLKLAARAPDAALAGPAYHYVHARRIDEFFDQVAAGEVTGC